MLLVLLLDLFLEVFVGKQDQLKAVMPEVLNAFQRREVAHVEPDEVPVHSKQEFKRDCDINEIMRKYQAGVSPPAWMTSKTPYYGDFSQLPQSLTEAHDVIARAEEAFMSLPLDMRRDLDHDFRNLDRAPREMFERYGLLKRPEERSGSAASTSGATESSRGSASRKASSDAQGSAGKADRSKSGTGGPVVDEGSS